MKEIKGYLKLKGWTREKDYEVEKGNYIFFYYSPYGEYQLHLSNSDYLFTDDSDEIEQDDIEITKQIIDRLHSEYIERGIKSY